MCVVKQIPLELQSDDIWKTIENRLITFLINPSWIKHRSNKRNGCIRSDARHWKNGMEAKGAIVGCQVWKLEITRAYINQVCRFSVCLQIAAQPQFNHLTTCCLTSQQVELLEYLDKLQWNRICDSGLELVGKRKGVSIEWKRQVIREMETRVQFYWFQQLQNSSWLADYIKFKVENDWEEKKTEEKVAVGRNWTKIIDWS